MRRWLLLLSLFTLSIEAKTYVFFSDRDPVVSHLIEWIDREEEGIDVAIYSFTHKKIEEALLRANARGVRVRLILDGSSEKMARDIFERGILDVALVVSPKKAFRPLFHHKFILFHHNKGARPWVWTGSFNLSNAAEKKNFENVVLMDTKSVFKDFNNYFNKTLEIIRK